MKNFKFLILNFAMLIAVFTSCTNEEDIMEIQQDTAESASIITTLNRLNEQYDDDGNVIVTENPAGNVVFDFCFDFVYPIDLIFNTGAIVTVNSLEELVAIYTGSTDDLFINGIVFPFQVEIYNEESNALEIETIIDEDAFFSLLEDCNFEEDEDCFCTEECDPVCVDITDLNGELFTLSYPNACLAICDGFSEDDFNEECEDDYEMGAGECFEFVYPISIILDEGTPITVNSNEELFNATYGAYHIDLVLPLEIIIEDGTVLTINTYEELENVIEDCFGNGYGEINCSIEDITDTLVNCFWQIDFVSDDQYLYNLNSDGSYQVQSDGELLTSGTWSIVAGNDTYYISLNADVSDYNDEWVVTECDESLELQSLLSPQAELYSIDCNDDNNVDCSIEDVSNVLSDCLWLIDFIDYNEFIYNFNMDGTYELQSENNLLTTGTWDILPANNAYTINLNATLAEYNDTWLIVDCYEEELIIVSIDYPQANIYAVNCDDDNDDDDDDNDYDCTSEAGISSILIACPWIIDFIDFNEFIYDFNADGTYEVQTDNNILTTGTWDLLLVNNGNDLMINLNAAVSEYNDSWIILDCDEEEGLSIGSIDYPQADIYVVSCD